MAKMFSGLEIALVFSQTGLETRFFHGALFDTSFHERKNAKMVAKLGMIKRTNA